MSAHRALPFGHATRVGIAVLAAGASRRLGQAKQLVSFRGQPLVRAAVQAALATGCARVGVVLGARAPEIAPCVSDLVGVEVISNPAWEAGLATSIHCATWWAIANHIPALVLAVADQPYLDTAHLDRLIAAHDNARGNPVASVYGGVRGVPAVFPATLYGRLLALKGDVGASAVLRGASDTVDVDWPGGAFDLDDANDLARLIG